MKAAAIIFPGSNCDRDVITTLERFGAAVTKIWYEQDELPSNLDLIVIPGGFSYGDYLRSGAMAAISPAMRAVKLAAARGVHILGICNGFQILTEAGLLPGALLRNRKGKFICRKMNLRVENNQSNFTSKYKARQIIKIPIAHMDGNYFADADTIKNLEDKNLIAFRYVSENGKIDEEDNEDSNENGNENGSINSIAGIFNQEKNILGMMPHPERASNAEIGSNDGAALFQSLLNITK